MSDKSVSIPERAREIAERWNGRTTLLNTLIECVTDAMHSERELCAKELEEWAKTLDYVRRWTLTDAAKLLREGGQK